MKALVFRFDFSFRILMDIVFYIIQILFFKIIYLHTTTIGGLNESQMMIFIGSYLLLDSIIMAVFANCFWWLPTQINKGDLDYYLLRPVSSLFFLTLRDFSTNSLVNVFIGIAFLAYSFNQYTHPISHLDLFCYFLFLFNGIIIYYFIRLFFVISAFWLQSPRGLDDVFWGLENVIRRPDHIFQGHFIHRIFTSILPLSLIVSYPCRFLFEGFQWKLILHILIVTILLIVGFRMTWKKGLRSYASASS